MLRLAFALVIVFGAAVAEAKPCPNVMLVLDQSPSMKQDVNGNDPDSSDFVGPSKWDLLIQVVQSVVTAYGDRVPFGVELFVIGNNSRTDDLCYNATSITVPLAHDSAGAILQLLKMTQPPDDGGTNTNGAIKRARMDPSLQSTAKPNYILLVTDGNPNCGTDALAVDPMTGHIAIEDGTTAWEIQQAAAQKPPVFTYVLGFDGDPAGVNTANLDDMAFYGLGPGQHPCGHEGQPHCYYTAGKTLKDFQDAFEKIISVFLGGEFGTYLCDDSCKESGCPKGQICTSSETDSSPHCEPDTCAGKSCPDGQFCRGGDCIKACTLGCQENESCVDGTCTKNLCFGSKCTAQSASQVCDPNTGNCIDFPCPDCRSGSKCDYATGKCVVDFCAAGQVQCPKGMTCEFNGQCLAPLGGVKGCSAGGVANGGKFDAGTPIAGAALLLSLAMMLRRRSAARA